MEVFLYVDGDGVGHKLDACVADNDLEAAASLSRGITEALHEMQDNLARDGARIIFCGGDNLLAVTELDGAFFRQLLDDFKRHSGCTASAGVGRTATEAYLGLVVAKSMGGGRTVFWNDLAWQAETLVPIRSPVDAPAEPRAIRKHKAG